MILGDMPFIEDAKNYVQKLAPSCTERLILEFLLQHGVGRHHAQVWSAIENHLREHGHTIRQQTFQQGLLKQSREGTIFIGSNDHGDGRGYFLIQDKEDAEVMREWYLRRIRVEQEHLKQLESLIHKHFGGKNAVASNSPKQDLPSARFVTRLSAPFSGKPIAAFG